MRWVFLSLVCFNLLVMVWFWRDQASVANYQAPADKHPSKGEGLILLSELQDNQLSYKSKSAGISKSNTPRCYSVGPFKDEDDAKYLGVRAKALGFSSDIRSLETGGSVENWVHIPPLANRQQSLQMLRELQGRGVDSYIITQGEFSEGISLGLFKNTTSAKNLTKKMREMGYQVVIKEVLRGEKELWLEFSQVAQLTEAMRKRIAGNEHTYSWMLTDCSD